MIRPIGESAVQAAMERINALAAEDRYMQQAAEAVAGQVGTSIPVIFDLLQKNFIVSPSNVGTGVFARMIETDETIWASVLFKNLMILSKIGAYTHDDPKIKEFVQGVLKNLKGPTWLETQESVLSANGMGFSISEIVYGVNENYQRVPVRVPTYHPNTIVFEVDRNGMITEDGILQFVRDTGFYRMADYYSLIRHGWRVTNPFTTPVDRLMPRRIPFLSEYGMVRIPRNKVIHHVANVGLSYGSPYGKTSVRVCHLPWQLKLFVLKQIGVGVKRNAFPFLFGQAPAGGQKIDWTDPETGTKSQIPPRQAFSEILAARRDDDSVVAGTEAEGYKLSGINNTANLDQMLNVVAQLNVFMFRAFLLPSLVMTDGSAGNRALGDKHFEIVDNVTDIEAEKFAETLINDLVKPMVEKEFGLQKDYGRFERKPMSLEARERLSRVFCDLGNGGWLKPQSQGDMEFVRDSLSLPEDTDPGLELNTPEDDDGVKPGTQIPSDKEEPAPAEGDA